MPAQAMVQAKNPSVEELQLENELRLTPGDLDLIEAELKKWGEDSLNGEPTGSWFYQEMIDRMRNGTETPDDVEQLLQLLKRMGGRP